MQIEHMNYDRTTDESGAVTHALILKVRPREGAGSWSREEARQFVESLAHGLLLGLGSMARPGFPETADPSDDDAFGSAC